MLVASVFASAAVIVVCSCSLRARAVCSCCVALPEIACSWVRVSMFPSSFCRSVVPSAAWPALPSRMFFAIVRRVSSSLPSSAASPEPSSVEMLVVTVTVAEGPTARLTLSLLPLYSSPEPVS